MSNILKVLEVLSESPVSWEDAAIKAVIARWLDIAHPSSLLK